VKRTNAARRPADTTARPTPDGFAEWCRRACLARPGATVDSPFGPDSEVFRIERKMFALLFHSPRVSEDMIVNLKAEPDELPLLIASHGFIRPGFHMNKKHWITVVLCPDADLHLVEDLIDDSYDNVVAGLPARLRSSLRSLGAAPPELSLLEPTGGQGGRAGPDQPAHGQRRSVPSRQVVHDDPAGGPTGAAS
jgi:predicted DNA-binding protein (MmcQ/YjbR family)